MTPKCLIKCFIFMTFLLALCQCQDRINPKRCDPTARPNSKGVCGHLLSVALTNICFLASYCNYPVLSSSEISALSSEQGQARFRREADHELLEKIYSIPLPSLATLDINENNWRSVVNRIGGENNKLLPEETTEDFTGSGEDVELPLNGKGILIRKMGKRSTDTTGLLPVQSVTRDLVCECCINTCTARDVVKYCN